MKHDKSTYRSCTQTGKYSYSSEAKALRAVNGYESIKRYYYCEYCNGWHTTKMNENIAVSNGVKDKPKRNRKVSNNKIQKRLNKLNNG